MLNKKENSHHCIREKFKHESIKSKTKKYVHGVQLQLHKSLVNSGNHLQPLVELPSGSTPPARRLHHQGARETRDVARRRQGADGAIDFCLGERKQLIQKQKSSAKPGGFFLFAPQKLKNPTILTNSWTIFGLNYPNSSRQICQYKVFKLLWGAPWINSHLVDDLSLFAEIAGTCSLVGNLWQVKWTHLL